MHEKKNAALGTPHYNLGYDFGTAPKKYAMIISFGVLLCFNGIATCENVLHICTHSL